MIVRLLWSEVLTAAAEHACLVMLSGYWHHSHYCCFVMSTYQGKLGTYGSQLQPDCDVGRVSSLVTWECRPLNLVNYSLASTPD